MEKKIEMYLPKGFIEDKEDGSSEYTPKGFIPDAVAPAPEESLGEKTLDFINKAGGTAGRAIGYGLADAINLPIDAANYANQKVAGLFGVKPQNVPTPSDFNAQSIPMPGISQQGQQQLDPLARGLATTAEFAVPAMDATKLVATLGKKGLEALQSKLGLAAQQKATNFMEDLLQGSNISDSHLPVLDELRENYNNAAEASSGKYKEVLNEGDQKRYTGAKQFPGISLNTGEKSITPNNFVNDVNRINLTSHSKDIQDLLSPFTKSINNNLSFRGAHDLQSKLGEEGAKLATNADGTQRYLGNQLLDLRNTLKDDITSSLTGNGDNDLANQYQNASDFFKTNVAPYRENATIRKVVMGQGLKEVNPSTIGNVLKKDDGAILPITNQLSDNSKKLLLANALKSATTLSPSKAGFLARGADPENLVNAYGKLDNKGLSYLMTPESQAKISAIMGDLSRQNKLKLGLRGAGILGGGFGMADLAKRYL